MTHGSHNRCRRRGIRPTTEGQKETSRSRTTEEIPQPTGRSQTTLFLGRMNPQRLRRGGKKRGKGETILICMGEVKVVAFHMRRRRMIVEGLDAKGGDGGAIGADLGHVNGG
eukprot:scaffold421674_cov79-Attheya_sp.AAC.1